MARWIERMDDILAEINDQESPLDARRRELKLVYSCSLWEKISELSSLFRNGIINQVTMDRSFLELMKLMEEIDSAINKVDFYEEF